MKMNLVSFGRVEIEGNRYDHDVVIEEGEVRKRKKGPSKAHRGRFGHTPLSAGEDLPLQGEKLFIGTGAYGSLPIMKDVYAEALRQGVEIVAGPTVEICEALKELEPRDVNAILHVTC